MKTKNKSDGYYHGIITLRLVPFAAILCALFSPDVIQGFLFGSIGCLLGLIIDPDLDQPMVTRSEWRVIKIPIVGILLGWIWVSFWFGYSLIMKHRGISHWPIIGTLTRVAWVLVPIVGILYFTEFKFEFNVHWIAIIVGLMIADIGHWWRDFGEKYGRIQTR